MSGDSTGPGTAPVTGSERLVTLDFIRGIAVLGILVANIVAMAHPFLAYSWPAAMGRPHGIADAMAWLAQYVLVDGKFRGLFTVLFGAGMVLFVERARAAGIGELLQARRLIWLALFGLAHFLLLFWGDILFLYAISGLAALGMLGWRRETQLRFGIVWYLTGSALFAAIGFSSLMIEQSEQARLAAPQAWEETQAYWDERLVEAGAEREAFTQGGYAGELAFVADVRGPMLAFQPFFAMLETLPLMLIGMALYRYGLFSGGLDPGRQRLWGWIGVLAGTAMALVLGLWAVVEGFPPFLTDFVFNDGAQATRLPVILGLAALLALWAPGAASGWLGRRVIAAGRMAFSNYIAMSLIAMLVFRQWAGGLWGELDRFQLWGIALAIWAVILVWSPLWLARYRYGPLEWLWRCLTYWKVFPLRR